MSRSATTVGFAQLLDELLLEVASHLSVPDLLSLKQTCRALYAFGCSDYLWHRVLRWIDLPLDLPPGVPPESLTHYQIQPIVRKALRLEHNWQRKVPAFKAIRLLPQGTTDGFAREIHFVPGSKWLLTVERRPKRDGRRTSHIELWSMEDEPYSIASLDVAGQYRTSAMELSKAGRSITLAAGCTKVDGSDYIEVYSIPFRDRSEFFDTAPTLAPLTTIPLPEHPAIPQETFRLVYPLSLSEGKLIGSVLPGSVSSALQVFVADPRTGVSRWLDPKYTQEFSDIWVNAYAHSGHILVLGLRRESIVLRIYRMPPSFAPHAPTDFDPNACGFTALGPLVAEERAPLACSAKLHDFVRVSAPSPSALAVMLVFSPPLAAGLRVGQVVRLALPFAPGGPRLRPAARGFILPLHGSRHLAQVGPSGRAVWLEDDWDAEPRRRHLMRFEIRKGDAVRPLLPADAALPFLSDTVHSLAFDDVVGRVCLGLFNGEIYVMDFV